MHRTLWRYAPATTDEELRALDRLREAGPEERDVPLGGRALRVRLALLVEEPCDGKAAVGVTLSFPAGAGADAEAEADAWGLCEEFLARRLER